MAKEVKKTTPKVTSVTERLATELSDLNGKISRLEAALATEGFKEKVGVAQYALMTNQLVVMIPYRDIVAARLKLLA